MGLGKADFERQPYGPDKHLFTSALTSTLGYLRRNTDLCPMCRLVTYAMVKNHGPIMGDKGDNLVWELIWIEVHHEYQPMNAKYQCGSGLYPRFKDGDGDDWTIQTIQLIEPHATAGFLQGRAISQSIDPELIRRWIKKCADEHGEDCRSAFFQISPHHPASKREFMVIDVTMACLVNLPPGKKYVTLSYIWGQVNHHTTIKSVLSDYRKPDAFRKIRLPRTIQDAIDLTRALHFQYLWVDALCVVQDDDETKGLLISSMDAVYRHSALTIVAASGLDADAGLEGWGSQSSSREIFTENMGPDWNLGVLPTFDKTFARSPHVKRGWT